MKKLGKKEIENLIMRNPDAYQYFFSKAQSKHLDWLKENGFLEKIKENTKEQKEYKYPILSYLSSIAEEVPDKVVDIIIDVPVSTESFDPDTISKFLYIFLELPVDQLRRVVKKINKERWVFLMSNYYNNYYYSNYYIYKIMLDKLIEAKDGESLLLLSESILTLKDSVSKEDKTNLSKTLFCFQSPKETGVFEVLQSIENEFTRQALKLILNTLSKIIILKGNKKNKGKKLAFDFNDEILLLDIDFFKLNQMQSKDYLSEKDLVEIVATTKILIERIVKCNHFENRIKNIYEKDICSLPDSLTAWRLRLLILGSYPKELKKELKKVYDHLFEFENLYVIMTSTEYLNSLKNGFPMLSEEAKRVFIDKVIKIFIKKQKSTKNVDKEMKVMGSSIFSMIVSTLNKYPRLKDKVISSGFEFFSDFEPKPLIYVDNSIRKKVKPMVTKDKFLKLSLSEISEKLQGDWSPQNILNQSNPYKSFVYMKDIENNIKDDINIRFEDYLKHSKLFFNRNSLDCHYTYIYLEAIRKHLAFHNKNLSNLNVDNIISILFSVKLSGEKKPFNKKRDDLNQNKISWLANWKDVHLAISRILILILSEYRKINFLKNRNLIFDILEYLLLYPDPHPEDESIETAKSKIKLARDDNYLIDSPHSIAINSVRGEAFMSLLHFIDKENESLEKNKVKIKKEVKNLYETILMKENTRAIMFMFGHYLMNLYCFDSSWIKTILFKILPLDKKDDLLYLAAWEGYLSSNLNPELFKEPYIKKLYKYGINLKIEKYPFQHNSKKPSVGIAEHFAIAYFYIKDFKLNDSLFQEFLNSGSIEQHQIFIRFIGKFIKKNFINKDEIDRNESLIDSKVVQKKLKVLWNELLATYSNKNLFSEFGSWFNLDDGLFDPAWLADMIKKTLIKTNGKLDCIYSLLDSLPLLAINAPRDTFEITSSFLKASISNEDPLFMNLELEPYKKWIQVLKTLYKIDNLKSDITLLINKLIEDGRDRYWPLKEVLKNE